MPTPKDIWTEIPNAHVWQTMIKTMEHAGLAVTIRQGGDRWEVAVHNPDTETWHKATDDDFPAAPCEAAEAAGFEE